MDSIKKEKVAICVCTYMRPQMLSRCISSLLELEYMNNWEIIINIIDNEKAPNNQLIVEGFQKHAKHVVHYIHEPQRGISHARNKALEVSLEQKADWIVFFDDDQYVDKKSLICAYETLKIHQADVAWMSLSYVFEENKRTEIFRNFYTKPRVSEDIMLSTCTTGGVMFHQSLILPDMFNLSFNPDFKFKTGEDVEEVIPERQTIRFFLYHHYSWGADDWNFYFRYQKIKLLDKYLSALVKITMVKLLLVPVYSLKGVVFLKSKVLEITAKAAWALGFLIGFLDIKTNKYE